MPPTLDALAHDALVLPPDQRVALAYRLGERPLFEAPSRFRSRLSPGFHADPENPPFGYGVCFHRL